MIEPPTPSRIERGQQGPTRLAAYFLPGLVFGILVLVWGARYVPPPLHQVPAWTGVWHEPKQPPGMFKSFRTEGTTVVAETEVWPHLHRRANAYLVSDRSYSGDVAVTVRLRFLRGRYLGCYLCFDPETDTGYWLATGHAVGEQPNHAYIKIVRNGAWTVVASAPLPLEPNVEHELRFERTGDRLQLVIDDRPIVTWQAAEFTHGHLQLRLHNTKAELLELKVASSGPMSVP